MQIHNFFLLRAPSSGNPLRAPSRTFLLLGFLLAALPLLLSNRAQAQASAPGQIPPADLQGEWKGSLGAGPAQLHLIVALEKQPEGAYAGTLDSVDQDATLPLSNVKIEGDSFRFEVPRVGGVYDARLNADHTEMTGTWTQAGVPPQPLSFRRSSASTASAPSPAAMPAAKPAAPAQKPITVPVDVVIPIAPTAFRADGAMHMAYELHVVNYGHANCRLKEVEALSGDSPAHSLGKFSGATLESMIARPGMPQAANRADIAPGSSAVIFIWLTVNSAKDVPAELRHRISAQVGEYPDALQIETAPLAVVRGPVVISSPLRGDQWQAANGPSNTSVHRRALIPINGRAVIAQRFAIDWIRLYPDGASFHGNPRDNRNYLAFGQPVYAVADGTITELKDGIAENVPGTPISPVTLETVAGNHLMLDIGNGRFALYAHLQPGSLRVRLGERVHRGQVLGLLGNTGNSTEPHLHFQICDGHSPLGSEGLPYAFASFEVQGTGAAWKAADSHAAPVEHRMEIPSEDEVVTFQESK